MGAFFILLPLTLSGCGTGMGTGAINTPPAAQKQPPEPWPAAQAFAPLDRDPLIVQNALGTFHIAAMVGVQPRELLFFYALQTQKWGTPWVEAFTGGAGTDGTVYSTTLDVNRIQPLGQLAEFDVGVIHLAWNDQLGPNIVLSIAPPGVKAAAWQMTLIDPQAVIPHKGAWWNWQFARPLRSIDQVQMACPCGRDGFRLALLGRSPQEVPPIYIKVDAEGAVSLLNEADFNAMWAVGEPGYPAGPTEDLEHPVFSPTYPPTPTWDPLAPTFTPSLPPPPPTALSSGLNIGEPSR